MYAPNAKIRIVGLGERSRKRRPYKRRLGVREFVRMPCLLPALIVVALGLLAVGVGAGMSAIGYVPSQVSQNHTKVPQTNSSVYNAQHNHDQKVLATKVYSYVGPILMALGMFAMITACVFYCEVLDKYTILVPDKRAGVFNKDELYEIIVAEMKKSYAQTLVTAYSKAAERSLLADSQSGSRDYLPEAIFPYKPTEPLTLEQHIDIECEGYTPSPPIPNKRYSIIQARIQRLKSEDNWLKTSSLPNIRRIASVKRAGRVGPKITDSRTLSCDYTMDEARLRRKSMMLRTIVQWNSGSSDLFAQRQRRFSSVKALPSEQRGSVGNISEQEYGSFPLTRLIQRRGTFACGDMRTRRMKFLLLLEASESQEGFNDSAPVDGRHTVAAIRRNSFIPYTTCDKFIAGEEKKTIRDRRRSSVNPFSLRNRIAPTAPQPTTRRHSFYPIRRDTRIYNVDPNENRRHSFNPVRMNNTLKPEFAAKMEGRRASFNPDIVQNRQDDRRPSYIHQHTSRFLQIPGLDPYMEGRPTTTNNDNLETPQHSNSDPGFSHQKSGLPQSFQDEKRIDRRHSFNPAVRLSTSGVDGSQYRVPSISINEDSPERFLTVPSQDYYIEERERRHSFNVSPTKSITASSKINEKPSPQRISFKLEPSASPTHLSLPSAQTIPKPTLKTSKASTEGIRPTSFKQEMVIFRPLKQSESRSGSPCSNTSCCGSEKIGSERSMAASRAASISSDRSARNTLNVSPVAADSSMLYGPFQQFVTHPKTNWEKETFIDPRSETLDSQTIFLNEMKMDAPLSITRPHRAGRIHRKSASYLYAEGRVRAPAEYADTPGSTNSGPAALSSITRREFQETVHRSKSVTALPGVEATRPVSPHTIISYARVPKPTSPLVARHKSQQYSDKKS